MKILHNTDGVREWLNLQDGETYLHFLDSQSLILSLLKDLFHFYLKICLEKKTYLTYLVLDNLKENYFGEHSMDCL